MPSATEGRTNNYSERVLLRQLASDTRAAARRRDLRGARYVLHVEGLNVANAGLRRVRQPRFYCPCCETPAYAFVHIGHREQPAWHSMCPTCGARSRHRALALLLPKLAGQAESILHFAPEALLGAVVRRELPVAAYQTADLFMDSVDYPGEDIQALTLPSDSFDLILCNHVLEHVADDSAALGEIARVLRPGGRALITIPGNWNREETLTFAEVSSNGHHRDYGSDVAATMEALFSKVTVVSFAGLGTGPGGLSYGIRDSDCVFVCDK